MESKRRREKLLARLGETERPLTGADLAQQLQVSRQVIVQDIAILRAGGANILATPQGYLLPSPPGGVQRTFACIHPYEGIEAELQMIIDLGGKVVDVVVEHPLYGELRGLLMLGSRSDLAEFMASLQTTKAQPLSTLTGGVHLHTVTAAKEATLARIGAALAAAGYLLPGD